MSTANPTLMIHIQRGEQGHGPYPIGQMQAMLAAGQLLPTDFAWHEGMTQWAQLDAVLRPHGIAFVAPTTRTDENLKWIVPVGRSGLAIAAGYAGLLSVLIFPAPIALLLGWLALRDLRKHPVQGGRGRAWFGLIMGGVFTALFATFLIVGAVKQP